jgi:RNA repair pathway DNA polymerase beta family
MDRIVRIKFGSHLYGTSTPESDTDYKSVYIPEAREILLQRVQDSVGTRKDKTERQKNLPGDVDDEAYSLQRYLMLLAEGQTVAVDMLFAPAAELTTPTWEHICRNRARLLTKRSAAFVGYCRQQANKYGIKGSRVEAAKNAAEFFNEYLQSNGPTAKVSDIENLLPDLFGDHTRVVTKETTASHNETYFECCNRMVGFKNTLKEAAAIYQRIYQEYGDRARRAQSNDGIDWKALSHAVRVGYEALELLRTGFITFPLPNAAHVLEIKQGKVPYSAVAEEIESLLIEVEAASEKSSLRDTADRDFIDELVLESYGRKVR